MQSLIAELRERMSELEQPIPVENNEEIDSLRNQVMILAESLEAARKEASEMNTPKRISEGVI